MFLQRLVALDFLLIKPLNCATAMEQFASCGGQTGVVTNGPQGDVYPTADSSEVGGKKERCCDTDESLVSHVVYLPRICSRLASPSLSERSIFSTISGKSSP